jgi:hypothetical protein
MRRGLDGARQSPTSSLGPARRPRRGVDRLSELRTGEKNRPAQGSRASARWALRAAATRRHPPNRRGKRQAVRNPGGIIRCLPVRTRGGRQDRALPLDARHESRCRATRAAGVEPSHVGERAASRCRMLVIPRARSNRHTEYQHHRPAAIATVFRSRARAWTAPSGPPSGPATRAQDIARRSHAGRESPSGSPWRVPMRMASCRMLTV